MKKHIIVSALFWSLVGCGQHGKLDSTSGTVGLDSEEQEFEAEQPVEEPDEGAAADPVEFDKCSEMAPLVAQPFPEDSRKFNKPWSRKDTSIVIDAYQGNSIDWTKMKTDKRVAGVIHRSSIGLTVDTLYKSRQELAKKHGFLWGAYHLGKSGDPIAQAKLFLKTIGDPNEVLMVLDLEDTSNSGMMNVANAKRFMQYVFEKTGRAPVIYANHSVTKILNSSAKTDPNFKKSLLWYARFRSDIPDFPRGLWSTYFLWQFSSEINCSKTGSCLYNVPGTKFDMDVNVFYGSKEALKEIWKSKTQLQWN